MISFLDFLNFSPINAASEAPQKRMTMDPCTPKGYFYTMESSKLSPSSLGENEKNRYALQSRGNYSECRTAAKMMLQKGKGYRHSP